MGDLFDAPRRRAQREYLTGAALVDHFLVEFAYPRAVGEKHTEESTIGNRSSVGDRNALCPRPCSQRALDPIPNNARAQFRELIGRVTA